MSIGSGCMIEARSDDTFDTQVYAPTCSDQKNLLAPPESYIPINHSLPSISKQCSIFQPSTQL